MKTHQKGRRKKFDDDRKDENLRGKLRELTKQVEQQNRIIKSLENKLTQRSAGGDKVVVEEKKTAALKCSACGCEEVLVAPFWHPKTQDSFRVSCNKCGHSDVLSVKP